MKGLSLDEFRRVRFYRKLLAIGQNAVIASWPARISTTHLIWYFEIKSQGPQIKLSQMGVFFILFSSCLYVFPLFWTFWLLLAINRYNSYMIHLEKDMNRL